MSWFESGNGDDVIGDAPADAVRRALDRIASASLSSRNRTLTLGELLAVIGAAMKRQPNCVDAGVGKLSGRVSARFADGSRERLPGTADEYATEILADALKEVASEYAQRWERMPRLTEVLETITFVLAPRLPRYIADPDADNLELEGLEEDS
jgi:hypothetical protein